MKFRFDRAAYWKEQSPQRIRDIAISTFGEINPALSNGSEVRFGTRGSKSVVLEGDNAGEWYDHEKNEGGLLRVPDEDFRLGEPPAPCTFTLGPRPISDDQIEKRKAARRLWSEAVPIEGTNAVQYLEKRGLSACLDLDGLRYHEATNALLIAATSPLEGVQGVQRVKLADPVTGKAISKKSLGPIGRGEIVFEDGDFDPANPKNKTLICEGVEDALSIWEAVQMRTTVPDLRVRVIPMLGQRWEKLAERHTGAIMVADADSIEAAERGALACAGCVCDPSPHKDANDLLRAEGPSALFAAIGKARRVEKPAPATFIKPLPDFLAGYVAPEYLVDGILQRARLYTFTAPTGHGKTAIVARLAEAVALGEQFCGVETEKGAVLFFAGENADDVKARFVAACATRNLDARSLPIHFAEGVFSIGDHLEVARTYANTIEGGIALVIVDTLQAYFVGDDDNSNAQMLEAARTLRELLTLPGQPAVVVPAHPIKNARKDNLIPRGGSALLNEVDGNLSVWTSDGVSKLHWHGKFRGPDFEPLTLELKRIYCVALKDAKGREMPTVRAEPVLTARGLEIASQAQRNEDAALRAIEANPTISMAELAAQIGCAKSTAHATRERLRMNKWIRPKGRGYALTAQGKEVLE